MFSCDSARRTPSPAATARIIGSTVDREAREDEDVGELIAEAWDAGGAYQVGSFPGQRWAEWNGRYRDDVRRFWRGDVGMTVGPTEDATINATRLRQIKNLLATLLLSRGVPMLLGGDEFRRTQGGNSGRYRLLSRALAVFSG